MEKDILVLFCEGPHDSAFVKLVFSRLLAFKNENIKLSEMPYPFGKLFKNIINSHAADDFSLSMAHKFFLPDTVMSKENHYVFIFNSGGKDEYEKIKQFIRRLVPLVNVANVFYDDATSITSSIKYLFLYDADIQTVEQIATKLRQELSDISDGNFMSSDWADSGYISGRVIEDKSLYVWGNEQNVGTLEDLLIPMLQSNYPEKVSQADQHLSEVFQWDTENNSPQRAVAEKAKKQKAIITVMGQRDKPGSSLNVVLGQSNLFTEQVLLTSEPTKKFVEFVKEFVLKIEA
ncbi:DUF3226 domain-containing protein [Rheinheimera sp. 4Y26]|uniref:DUF3226 domain-containing protein n=1 Tax=Rheinheimera sp. 4Y26 TaxID=2977811 RepID=UPI0021B09377|nr:DUF3226 domain-containing protein [Rheinheimera sp. 4Y26]MCT6699296.1 hypothetical protein [Rheinheimera sp. 4Y26]